MRIGRVALAVSADGLDRVAGFYFDGLGLGGERLGASVGLEVGRAKLRFDARAGGNEPFYHFALLVPGNRFEAAREWLGAGAPLLTRPGSDETDFEFAAWYAHACYAHDLAGNIVELIAHRGLDESSEVGAFSAAELRGISEIGVVDPGPPAAVERLRRQASSSGQARRRPGRRRSLSSAARRTH